MSFGEDMAVFSSGPSGMWFASYRLQPMPFMNPSNLSGIRKKCHLAVLAVFAFPALVMAHPGHHHPGEEDEFDALRSNWLHLHGAWEISFALIAVAAVLVFHFNKRRGIRIAAAFAFGGSLALLAVA